MRLIDERVDGADGAERIEQVAQIAHAFSVDRFGQLLRFAQLPRLRGLLRPRENSEIDFQDLLALPQLQMNIRVIC